MTQRQEPPKYNDWKQIHPLIQIYIALRVFVAVDLPRHIYRVDLWLFPPGMFYATYILATKNFPEHPIKMIAVLSTAFMFGALSLLLIRPRKLKWKKIAHWVKP